MPWLHPSILLNQLVELQINGMYFVHHISSAECMSLHAQGMAPDALTPCKIRAPSASSEVLKLLATLDPARSVSITAAADGAARSPHASHHPSCPSGV